MFHLRVISSILLDKDNVEWWDGWIKPTLPFGFKTRYSSWKLSIIACLSTTCPKNGSSIYKCSATPTSNIPSTELLANGKTKISPCTTSSSPDALAFNNESIEISKPIGYTSLSNNCS